MTPAVGASLRRPRALLPGDRVAVVAPASSFNRDDFDAGIGELRSLGFDPVFDESVFLRRGYIAGAAQARADALKRAWMDPTIAAIVAARGGYGSVQLLPYLDPAQMPAKVFVGSSDLTSLQTFLLQRARMVTFYGPMPAGCLSRGAEGYERDTFLRAVTSVGPLGELPAPRLETVVAGETAGVLVGGTLTQLAASLGTPYAFDPPTGAVLLIEDVAERPYRLDRLVTQLLLSGILARVSGVILGTFPGCDEPGGECTARQTLASLFAEFRGPVVYGLPVGHVDGPVLTVPLGVTTRIVAQGNRPRVIVEEAGVV